MDEQKPQETNQPTDANDSSTPPVADAPADQTAPTQSPAQESTQKLVSSDKPEDKPTEKPEESSPDKPTDTPEPTPPATDTAAPAADAAEATSMSTPPTQTAGTPPPPAATQPKKDRFFPIIILLILLFVGVLVVAAWYFQTQLQKSTSQTAAVPVPTNTFPKQIVVGTDPTFQPMEYTDKGKMIGYDIDLANLLAKQLHTKIMIKNITFDNLFPALKQHQIDMIISAVTITDARKKQFSFSEPYLNAGQVIITQKTETTIKSPKQLSGKKIGVQQGTTDEQEALKYTTSNLVIKYPDFEKATAALVAGSVDAIITDLPSAQGIVSSNPTLKISSDPFTNDYYGIVLRKGDPNVQAVNKALDQLRVRGFLTELKYKWLD